MDYTCRMIFSMTGFARNEVENGQRKCVVEIRSVNHRFLDINVRIPSRDFELEKKIKNMVAAKLVRGSVELSVTFSDMDNGKGNLVLDREMVRQYLAAAEEVKENFTVYGEADLPTILGMKDVFKYEEPETDFEERWALMETAIGGGLEKLLAMRMEEGRNLKEDIAGRLDSIEENADLIMKTSRDMEKKIAEKIRSRITEMFSGLDIDEARLLMEAAILADRCDITEELIRLKSHIEQAGKLLQDGGCAGRKLEFMVQEMNREANTIGSKSGIYEISHEVVEIKSSLEKIREQAANIE